MSELTEAQARQTADRTKVAVLAGMDAMRLFLGLPLYNHTPAQIAEMARAAAEGGEKP